MYKITHALIAIPNNILIPIDSRTRKSHNQTFRHITTQKDTYKWSFIPHTIVQWNILPQTIISSPSIDSFREQLTPALKHLNFKYNCTYSQTCLSDPLHITTSCVIRPNLFLPCVFPFIWPLYNDPLSNATNDHVFRVVVDWKSCVERLNIKPEVRK